MMILKMQTNRVAALIAGAAVTVAFCAIGRSDVPKTGSDIQTQQHDASGNWPAFRGPNRDNISPDTGLLKQWPKGGPPLAWKATGLGDGFASIAIADGRLYTQGAQNQEAAVIAMDAKGKKLWSGKLGSGSVDKPGPRSTPTVDGERVYGLDEVGDLGCFDTANGKQVWKINLARDLHGAMMSGWGYSESVLIDGDKLLCTPGGSDGTVAALDKNTGKVIWRSKALTDPAAYASLVPTTIGGTVQYIVFTGKHVAGIGTDGAVLWSAARRGQTAVIPTPIVHGNLVFVTSEYKIGCNLFQVTGSGNSLKVEELYHNTDMMVKHGGAVLVGDYVYGISTKRRGILTCMELKTGKVAWTDKAVDSLGSIAYADGMLYVRSENGSVILVEATPDGYHERGRFDQPNRSGRNSWAHPVVFGGKLYLRDQDVLLCYDVKAK